MIKLALFTILYNAGDINLVVDTKVDGVKVPAHLCGKIVNFIVGKYPSPLLEADEHGIVTPLRFGGERFVCSFPWSSIRAMISEEAVVNFPGDEAANDHKPHKPSSPLKVVK